MDRHIQIKVDSDIDVYIAMYQLHEVQNGRKKPNKKQSVAFFAMKGAEAWSEQQEQIQESENEKA